MQYQLERHCEASQLVKITPGRYPLVGVSQSIVIEPGDTAVLVETIGNNKGVRCWHALSGDQLFLVWEDKIHEVKNEVLDKQ